MYGELYTAYVSLVTEASPTMTINAHCGGIHAIHNVKHIYCIYATSHDEDEYGWKKNYIYLVQNTIGLNKDSKNDVRSL